MTKNLAVLGSTGSIGRQSLDVARKCGFGVEALSAFSDAKTLECQIREFRPSIAALADERAAADLRARVADTGTRVLAGTDGVCACAAAKKADTVLNAIVGLAGLRPSLTALETRKKLALANKESLVAGGRLVLETAEKAKVPILPVDSEHSAIFQVLQGRPPGPALKKILLTASGGPFFGKNREELRFVTAADALRHPTWSMGAKITVDSATMMNKGLELIEAVRLFGVSPEQVEIIIHRESIVHSAVEYDDNSVVAQLGLPDMRLPIQYALTYPERLPSPVGEIDFAGLAKLTFFRPDFETFGCMELCREAVRRGGLYPAAVNGANEQANLMFREGKLGFLEIEERIRAVMEAAPKTDGYTLEDVLDMDASAREQVRNF